MWFASLVVLSASCLDCLTCAGTIHCFEAQAHAVNVVIGPHTLTFAFTWLLSCCVCVSSGGVGCVPTVHTLPYAFSFFFNAKILTPDTPDQVCVVLNNKGVRVCTVCKSPYKASVRLPGDESISLFQSPLPPPYILSLIHI